MTVESVATIISSYLPNFQTRAVLLIALPVLVILINFVSTETIRKKITCFLHFCSTTIKRIIKPILNMLSKIKKKPTKKTEEQTDTNKITTSKQPDNQKNEKTPLARPRKLIAVLLIGNILIIGSTLAITLTSLFPIWTGFYITDNMLLWIAGSFFLLLTVFNAIFIPLQRYSRKSHLEQKTTKNQDVALQNPFAQDNGNEIKKKVSKLRLFIVRLKKKIRKVRMGKLILTIFNITAVCSIVTIIFSILFAKPFAILATPKKGTYMTDGHTSIEITFTTPVYKDLLELNISPEIKGNWEIQDLIPGGNTPYTAKVIFHPEESFTAEDKVVLYLVGLKRLASNGHLHEQAMEFFAPKTPEIKSIFPTNNTENVSTTQSTIITYTSPIGQFSVIEHKITPKIEFTVLDQNNTHQLIQFSKPLKQDTTYKIETHRTLRTYDPADFSDIERGETILINTSTFHTVATPSIKKYSPKGDSVLAESIIQIEFVEDMERESVESAFQITPETTGSISWSNEKSFIFTPEKPLIKETEHTITFEKGLITRYGGTTEETIVLTFTTIGKVAVSKITPRHKSTNIEPINLQVSVLFNQEVDHDSAQANFSITPNVAGNFSWDKNKLIYKFSKTLAYSTRYNISLETGIKTINGLDSDTDYKYYFTTRSNRFELNIPLYYQSESHTCNIAATRMALGYRGISVSENQIRNSIGTGGNPNQDWVAGYDVHWGPVATYIRQYRSADIHQGWNTADLAREVQKGNPVILFWNNRYTSGVFTLPSGATGYRGMHSEVVRGFIGPVNNPTSLLTNDPWRGRLIYSRSLFDSTWSYINHTAVVVK